MKKMILLFLLNLCVVVGFSQATYYWVGGASAAYNVATSWNTTLGGGGSSRSATNVGDILVFDGSNVGGGVTATAITASAVAYETISQLLIQNNVTVTFSTAPGTSGGGTITRTTTALTGTGSSFSSFFVVGDFLFSGTTSNYSEITAIASNTALTTAESGTISTAVSYLRATQLRLTATTNALVVSSGCGLNMSATAPLVIRVVSGASTIINGAIATTTAAQRLVGTSGGGITFASGSTFTTGASTSGSQFGIVNTVTNNNIVFQSGSSYIHGGASNPYGATGPASVVDFQLGSTSQYNSATGFSSTDRQFGHLIINATIAGSGAPLRILGDLTVKSGFTFQFNNNSTNPILGNVIVESGGLISATASSPILLFCGTGTQIISGAGTIGTGGTLARIVVGTFSNVLLNQNIVLAPTSGSQSSIVGTLNTGTNTITGNANASMIVRAAATVPVTAFTTTAGSNSITTAQSISSVNIGMLATGTGIPANTAVIAASGTIVRLSQPVTASNSGLTVTFTNGIGSIVTANTSGISSALPSFSAYALTGGNYTFNGATTTPFPAATTVNNFTIGANVTLNSATTINGILTDSSGTLSTGANNLTLNATTGSAIFTPKSNLNISGGITNFNGRPITLQSSALGTASISTITGDNSTNGLLNASNVTVERYIPSNSRRKYTFVGSPVTSTINAGWQEANATVTGYGTAITGGVAQGINGFDGPASSASSIFTYNDTLTLPGSKWTALANTTTAASLAPGTGYLLFVRGDRSIDRASNPATSSNTVLRATGTVGLGNITLNGLPGASKFTLVANPYPCAIDWNSGSITRTNLTTTFYTYDANLGVFVSSNGSSVSPNTGQQQAGFIQSGQAFFIQNDATGDNTTTRSIAFTEAVKSTVATTTSATTVFGETVDRPQLNLNIYRTQGNVFADGVVAVFNKDYKTGLDKEDANKFNNFNETFALRRNGQALSIEGRPLVTGNDTLYFNLANFGKRDYTFTIDGSNFTNTKATLEDKYTSTKTPIDLSGNTTYKFTVNDEAASNANDRFTITFGSTATIVSNDIATTNSLFVKMSPNPVSNQLQVSFKTEKAEQTTINIINSLGQIVRSINAGKVDNGNVSIPMTIMASGIYTVQLLSGDKQISVQKIVKE